MRANEEIPVMKYIKCASIQLFFGGFKEWDEGDNKIDAELAVGFTKEDYDNFIKKLDVKYDEGYGTQKLHGTIWLTDGTWMDRGEYDGSEWWNHQKVPKIPNELLTLKT